MKVASLVEGSRSEWILVLSRQFNCGFILKFCQTHTHRPKNAASPFLPHILSFRSESSKLSSSFHRGFNHSLFGMDDQSVEPSHPLSSTSNCFSVNSLRFPHCFAFWHWWWNRLRYQASCSLVFFIFFLKNETLVLNFNHLE